MDGVGGEVSHKIKAAIKAKLVELEAYVDDELPDYIMVMVANKRNRKQMEDDLSLFLNNNTKVFTAWLHTVLQKLQEVTVASKDKKEKSSTEAKKTTKKKRSGSRDSVASKDKSKSKKKHAKKHKEKKEKKKSKRAKSKERPKIPEKGTVAKAADLSDWEEDVAPPPKKVVKNGDEFDVSKEIGRAIIGTLKERHKNDEKESAEVSRSEPRTAEKEPAKESSPPAKSPTPVEAETAKPASGKQPDDFVQEAQLEKNATIATEEVCIEENYSVTSLKSVEKLQVEPTVMAPTKALLKEHDKLTKTAAPDVTEGIVDQRAVSRVSSDSSVSPEELRRQLLLSRAKKKMEERNLESRMRSNSPEVVFVEEKPSQKPDPEEFDISARPAEIAIAPGSAKPSKSESKSSQLSLKASSFGSPERRPSSPKQTRNETRSKVVVASRVVPAPEPELPEVSSVVLVRPREFNPAEKQANKNLILKAVAAAERSIAHAPSRKDKSQSPPAAARPRAVYTKNLRRKRYENFEVTLPNEARRASSQEKKSTDDTFISSKKDGKENNASYIESWLSQVEEAGQNDQLVKPSEMDDSNQLSDDVEEIVKTASDDEPMDGGAHIVVTVDGIKSFKSSSSRGSKEKHSASNLKTISDRFATISQDDDEHEFKEKFLEFERKRIEKKVSRDGHYRNKRLIAQLSMKFGQIDRVFDDEDNLGVRKRLTYLNKAFEDAEKGLPPHKDGKEEVRKEPSMEKKLSRSAGEKGDRGVKRRLDSIKDSRERRSASLESLDRGSKRVGRSYDERDRRGYQDSERRRTEPARRRERESDVGDENRRRDSSRESLPPRRRRVSHSDRSDDEERRGGRRRMEDRKRDHSPDESPRKDKKNRRSVRVSAEDDDSSLRRKERCKFWPDCVRGSSCDFHHPTSICKLLPHCKFREKCLYIHPLCKNDRACSLSDCAYEHSGQRRSGLPLRDSTKIMCKYDSYCKNPDCQYQHSRKTCKFGSRCSNRACSFDHTISK